MDNQNIETAIAEAIKHVSSRKLGAVVLGMWFLGKAEGAAWMILALGIAYVLGNVVMGVATLLITGRPENGSLANSVLRERNPVLHFDDSSIAEPLGDALDEAPADG